MNVVTSLVFPQGIPAPFDLGTKKKKKSAPPPYRALLYISMIPTQTLTFDHLPQFVFGVPETVIASLGDKWDIGLGYFDPTDKAKKFKLEIADRIAVASPAPTPTPTATPTQTPTPTPSPTPSPNPSASHSPTPSPSPVPTPTVNLIAIGFASPEMPVTLQANKTYVFVLYAITGTPPSAAPSGSAEPHASATPTSAATGAVASPSPAASASSTSTATSAPRT
jgi:outer membrane biosynthesis protein TonB